jgi:hypothetical protein
MQIIQLLLSINNLCFDQEDPGGRELPPGLECDSELLPITTTYAQ